ncbi:glycosyltransferase family 9 protein [Vulcaniibacterium tengchongense]|uniref:Glycosyl transferase family 9 (Putative heptosyltransferase) n=1 Tax=Vulcaniibacterium tengchongense TaxID=1273429 RepID=A0A3N4VF39_9GAMM|nr:glycosyltransferase family 9 protein [Vulcaniibacterium tengchongense]RPE81592.1 glycosyl transferase family 9 (putative heptosyltransferase) [Vulcaniibacterium tengchongense]
MRTNPAMNPMQGRAAPTAAADEAAGVAAPRDPMRAWLRHMRRGEWGRAWAITDRELPARARTPCWHWPRHLQYVWTGEPLAGRRVLVRCYHGLGDTLQFVRYLPLLKAVAAETLLWAQPKLIPLLRGMAGVDRVLPLHDGAPGVEYDVDVEIMELAHVFRSTPDTVPARVPYLHAEPMPLPPAGRPAVGLVWKAGDWQPQRSIPWPLLAPFAQVRGATLYVLQPQAAEAGWRGEFGRHLGEFDVADYARVLRAMDLLITIDSMPAHLAGALGVPVWTLLSADPDWRWMEGRTDTPWYPQMRLFRQKRAGNWRSLVDEVAAELAAFADARRA